MNKNVKNTAAAASDQTAVPTIEIAAHAGTCYGVQRALDMALAAAPQAGETAQVHTLGPLIHNPIVVSELAEAGIGLAESLDDAGSGTVIIRAHGVVPQVIDAAHDRGLTVVDATCPYVKKVHMAAERLVREGYHVVVVGEPGHPEVEGILGHAGDDAQVVSCAADADALPLKGKVGLVVQTTQTAQNLADVVAAITPRVQELRVINTICAATGRRRTCQPLRLHGRRGRQKLRQHPPPGADLRRRLRAHASYRGGKRARGRMVCRRAPHRYHRRRFYPARTHRTRRRAHQGALPLIMDQTVPAYAAEVADYGRSRDPEPGEGALVKSVRPESPAWDVGIEPGMRVLTVNGEQLTDMIVWLWEADDDTVDLEVFDPRDNSVTPVELDRFPGEDWGLEFDGPIFDGMRTCVNACVFCFMTMLPKGGRSTLYIRDDDYRLSFLQGNFVTLTNLTDDDVQNVIERNMSPMNVSVHAVSPDVRRRMMGRNAQRGMDVLEAIMAAGIEIHAQIVLCPGMNDGEELQKTLRFCEEHEQITSLGIVPLGFTKHQNRFTWSYSDKPELARETIAMIRPFQDRAYERFGRHTFQMSDEFYLDAGIDPPEADFYDGYPQYYDGIGMIRSYLDETDDVLAADAERLARVREAIAGRGQRLLCLSGASARDTVARFVESSQGLDGTVTAIKNHYFGGNVDVTGLIVACDILEQLPQDLSGVMLFVPKLMFNADGMTLDEYHRDDLLASLTSRGAEVHVVSTMPHELLDTLEHILGIVPADSTNSADPTH